MIDIKNNFLEQKDFHVIKEMFHSDNFPWYFNKGITHNPPKKLKLNDYQFVHIFYSNGSINSDFFNYLAPILNKLKIFSIIRIKANLLPRTEINLESGMHTDFVLKDNKIKTGIFYLDDSNGYTKFEDGTKFKSTKNSYVEFDSKLKHTGSTCTDNDTRIVINFNYIKND